MKTTDCRKYDTETRQETRKLEEGKTRKKETRRKGKTKMGKK